MQTSSELDREYATAAEHEKAAMLAEFNGTYELARFHRDRAARLRQVGTARGRA